MNPHRHHAMTFLVGLLAAVWAIALCAPAHAIERWDITQPRGTPRLIDFTTTEGTWMSVDVAPTGDWLVFDLLGHVYRLPIAGGQATALTQDSGVALNFHPRVSPDGRTVAFISDRAGYPALWLMDANGSRPRLLAQDARYRMTEPAWSADGKTVLVNTKRADLELQTSGTRAYAVAGGPGRQLVPAQAQEIIGAPQALASGDVLYHHAPPSEYEMADMFGPGYTIRRFDARTRSSRVVVQGHTGSIAPLLSPDGRQLAFARRLPDSTNAYEGREFGPRTALWVRDLATGRERVAVDPIENDLADGWAANQKSRVLPGYAWTPDGQSIVIASGGKLRRHDLRSSQTTDIAFQARVVRQISERTWSRHPISDGAVQARMPRWPAVSPQAEGPLLFQSFGRLWAQGQGEPIKLSESEPNATEYTPAWSDDGRWIAFSTWEDGVGGQLWKLSAEGQQRLKLSTEAATYFAPNWHPDGRRLVVLRAPNRIGQGLGPAEVDRWQVVVVPAEGGTERVVAEIDSPERDLPMPRFGADGRIWLAQQTQRNGRLQVELVSVGADGTGRRVHLSSPFATGMAASRDGRRVALERAGELYLVDIARLRGRVALTEADFANVDAAGDRAVHRISERGGLHAQWRDANTLVFADGPSVVRYDTRARSRQVIGVAPSLPRAIPQQTLALRGARLITLDRQAVLEDADLLIRNGRIACIGRCDLSGARRVIDAGGATVVPGFIDMHTASGALRNKVFTPRVDVVTATPLAYGVTTGFHPSTWSQFVYPMAELIEAGLAVGPRLFTAGDKLRASAGPWEARIAAPVDAQRIAQRVAGWGGVALKEQQHLQARSRADLQMLAQAARANGLQISGHLHFGWLEQDLAMAMDGYTGAQHYPMHLPLYGDVIRFIGQAGFAHNATMSYASNQPNVNHFVAQGAFWQDERLRQFWPRDQRTDILQSYRHRPDSDYAFQVQALNMRDIAKAGGSTAIGVEGEPPGLGMHQHLWMMASGMGPMAALEAGSLNGARFLGMEDDLGSIEIGKLADLVILDANPLDDIRNTLKIRAVLKAGVVYDRATLDSWAPKSVGGAAAAAGHVWMHRAGLPHRCD